MPDERDILELLKFELKFLEDGGYGRSPHTPWRPSFMFEDSPSCLNFDDAAKPHPCTECWLTQFVPQERRQESSACRYVPLNEAGQTIEDLYRTGTQIELEEALAQWLRREISRIETERANVA